MAETKDFFLAVYLLAVDETMTDLQVQPEEIFRFADSPMLQERYACPNLSGMSRRRCTA